MALSYDRDTRMTTGFLGRTVEKLEVGDEKDEFLEMLERLEANAAHPLLLPVLMYSVCSNMLRRQLRQVNRKMDAVQHKTGVLDGYLRLGTTKHAAADSQGKKDKPDYDALHKDLVGEHARLTKGLSDFVREFGFAFRRSFEDIEKSDFGNLVLNETSAHEELKLFVSRLDTAANFKLQHRERMLSRVDMQLKVVCAFEPRLTDAEHFTDRSTVYCVVVQSDATENRR